MAKSAISERDVGSETYGFDAIRGTQAGREFYIVMCPLKIIPKLFIFNDHELPPELRAQRTLKESRIPAIKNYILENPDNYIFSSLTASVDGTMRFIPFVSLGPDGKIGRLYVNMDSRLLINDGQHRRSAIEAALKERPKLGHKTISVVFFQDSDLERSQQMFSDLNKNAVKPTKSLNILYNHRDEVSKFMVQMTKEIPIFKDRVEMEGTTLSNRTAKAFTLNGVTDATMRLLGSRKMNTITLEQKKIVVEFWNFLADVIPGWQLLLQGEMRPQQIRREFIYGNTNVLNALGIAGHAIIAEYPDSWKKKISKLRDVDWSRSNPKWEGNLMQGGRMVKTAMGIELGANVLIESCGVKLSKARMEFEAKR